MLAALYLAYTCWNSPTKENMPLHAVHGTIVTVTVPVVPVPYLLPYLAI